MRGPVVPWTPRRPPRTSGTGPTSPARPPWRVAEHPAPSRATYREAWDAALDRVRAQPGLVLDAWTAYALEATSVEFWASSGAGQTRLRYTAASGAPTTWTKELLWP